MKKTTLYIEPDEDIASIIQKVTSSSEKIVALVLPKRPSVMQSSVNMRLLQRSGTKAEKNLVLISQDEQVVRLASQTGMYVAKTLQSKPAVPKADTIPDTIEEIDDTAELGASSAPVKSTLATDPAQPDVYKDDEKIDLSTPVGDLTGTEEIELDNAEVTQDEVDEVVKKAEKKKKSFKVPSFGTFRNRFVLGGAALVLLVAFLIWALVIAPTAQVTLATSKSEKGAKITLTASKAQTAVDKTALTVPAETKEDIQKLSTSFAATGQKDVGTKASGEITVRNCDYSDGFTLPAGTRFTSSGAAFVSTESVVVPQFTGSASSCSLSGDKSGKATVSVVAEKVGDTFNLSARNYSIGSISDSDEVDAVGSAMSGGTSKIIKVVTQADIESAKAKALESSADNVKGKLVESIKSQGLFPLEETFVSSQGEPVSSVAVDAEAPADPTLTIEVKSTMLGVKDSDIDPFIKDEVNKLIDQSKEKIYDNGLGSAQINVLERPSAEVVKFELSVNASVGPNIDATQLASEIKGKKAGEAKQLLEARPGVTSAEIRLSPFWVFSMPKNDKKITITVNE